MIRVLIVDDSPTSREIIANILGSDPDIEVVGTAQNGREGVKLAKELLPNLVTMDIHMPVMDGFEATKDIMIECPRPIVLVSASTMVHEVEAGMQALRAGAITLLLKPPGPGAADFDRAAKELIDTVKAMADVKVVRHYRRAATETSVAPTPTKLSVPASTNFRVIAIATSTGGPPALNRMLCELPADFPVPILVVQHIAAGFVDGFAHWLNSVIPLNVKIGEDGEYLQPGSVYIAPQERHLGVTRGGRIALSDEPPIGGFKPAASYLFESVAKAFGDQVIAFILTGMGNDGVAGLRNVQSAGGVVIAQDEDTSIVFGMPAAAIRAGLASLVLPIERMASQLMYLVAREAK